MNVLGNLVLHIKVKISPCEYFWQCHVRVDEVLRCNIKYYFCAFRLIMLWRHWKKHWLKGLVLHQWLRWTFWGDKKSLKHLPGGSLWSNFSWLGKSGGGPQRLAVDFCQDSKVHVNKWSSGGSALPPAFDSDSSISSIGISGWFSWKVLTNRCLANRCSCKSLSSILSSDFSHLKLLK